MQLGRRRVRAAARFALRVGLALVCNVGAASAGSVIDTTPPQLTALSITPAAVDLAMGDATLTVDYTVTDDLSGADYVTVTLTPPGGGCLPGGIDQFPEALTHSGTITVELGQLNTPNGAWSICQLDVYDGYGNRSIYSAADLAALGLPSAFTVAGTPDTVAPQLTALSVTPANVDLTMNDATVTVNFTITDDIAGATHFAMNVMPPGGECTPGPDKSFAAERIVYDAVTLPFAQFTTPIGTWTICQLALSDAAGNTRTYTAADLGVLGLPSQFTVAGSQDTTAPQITALSITPTIADISSGDLTISVDYTVTDDLSGVVAVEIGFRRPADGYCGHGQDIFPAALTYSGHDVLRFNQFEVEAVGSWSICFVLLSDAAHNFRTYSTSDLTGLGLPTEFTIISTAPPTVTAASTSTPELTGTPTPTDTPAASPTATPTPSPSPTATTPAPCPGDCDGSGMVTVDDLLRMVNIDLGSAPVADCAAGDVVEDGTITVDEILLAVNRALTGC